MPRFKFRETESGMELLGAGEREGQLVCHFEEMVVMAAQHSD